MASWDWRRGLSHWRPPRVCALCGAAGQAGLDLCPACVADFPCNDRCCARCGLPLAQSLPLCGRCQRRAPPWDRTWAPFRYEWPLAPLETRFKFAADLTAGQILGALWAQQSPPPERPQALLPVPLHRRRLRQRGFNQALELATVLARRYQLPLRCHALRRLRATQAQTGLGAAARRHNLRAALGPGRQLRRLPPHVALVDDVMTTGATLEACCRVLRQAGVARIDLWVLARARAPGTGR